MGSACYVYAVVGRDTPLPALAVDGVELTKLPAGDLAAVATLGAAPRTPVTVDAVLRHEMVVEAVRRIGPALPVRFGTVFGDATTVAAVLDARHDGLAADLARIGDKVELSVTALWPATPFGGDRASAARDASHAALSPGRQYLRERADDFRRDEALKERARSIAHAMDRELGALALEQKLSLRPAAGIAARAAYLIDPSRVADFRAAFARLRERDAELRVFMTGPWPPYSFVRRADGEQVQAAAERVASLARRSTDAMQGAPAERPQREWTTEQP